MAHCAKKFGEEAVETALAAIGEDKDRLIAETADLLYHLLVVLEAREVTLAEVEAGAGRTHRALRPGGKGVASARLRRMMEQRTGPEVSPYRVFSRAEWAALREDTPMTLTPAEVAALALHA